MFVFGEALTPVRFSKNNTKCLFWNAEKCWLLTQFLWEKWPTAWKAKNSQVWSKHVRKLCQKKQLLQKIVTSLFLVRRLHQLSLEISKIMDCLLNSLAKSRHTAWKAKNCPIWSTNARKFSRDAFTSSIERKECQVFIFKCPPMLSDGYIPLGRKKPTDSFIKTISNGWFEIPKFIMQCLERVERSRIKRDKSASSA